MVQTARVRSTHMVRCCYCGNEFDLIDATWCGCGARVDRPSKACPNCLRCLCLHPDYDCELFWGAAPRYLSRHGFEKLFYLYI